MNELILGNKIISVLGVESPAGTFALPILASDPGSPTNGYMYYNSTSNTAKIYQAGAWETISIGSGGGASYFVNRITLTSTDIANKYVTLTGTPTTLTATILHIIGGIIQDYSVDFTVTGSQLSWNGLGLDGVLEDGDKLVIQFN
jgi:hypothetical protein